MHETKIAAAPISWGVCEVPGWGAQPAAERVLDDAARIGFRAIEAGPPGFLPADGAAAARLLDDRGLRLVAGFVTGVLHDPARREAELASIERQAAWLSAARAEMLVLAATTGADGYDSAVELDDAGWRELVASLAAVARLANAAGLTLVVHPHVGTVIERPRHIDRLLAVSSVGLCLDTGHVFVAGGDAAAIARAAGRRVRHVHLKDADATLATAVRERRLPYGEAVRKGLFRPLGAGDARIDGVLTELRVSGYDGWYVLEQDVALASADADPTPAIRTSLTFVSARV